MALGSAQRIMRLGIANMKWLGLILGILVVQAITVYLVGLYLIGHTPRTFWNSVRKAQRIDQGTYDGQMELARRIQAEEDARGD